jgi:hypothetical protein
MWYTRISDKNTPARIVARQVYDTLDGGLRIRIEQIGHHKKIEGEQRKHLAHPNISETQLDNFLHGLGDGPEGLGTQEVQLFDHLRQTSIALQATLWG